MSPIPGLLIGLAYGASKAIAALSITAKTLGTIGTIVGGAAMANDAMNRGDYGSAMYKGGKALKALGKATQ